MNMPTLPRQSRWERCNKNSSTLQLLLWFFILLIFLGIGLVGMARAEVVDLNIIKQIESAGNPLAVSRTGAVGLYQLMPCVLSEYNSFNKANHSRPDLFNPAVNEKIAKWYLGKRIPQMLKAHKLPITLETILWAYNAGVGRVKQGFMPSETKNYIKKYQRLARRS